MVNQLLEKKKEKKKKVKNKNEYINDTNKIKKNAIITIFYYLIFMKFSSYVLCY